MNSTVTACCWRIFFVLFFVFWVCDVIIVCFWRGGRRGVGRGEEVEVGEPLEFGLTVPEGFSWQAQRWWWWRELGILECGREILNLFGRFWIAVALLLNSIALGCILQVTDSSFGCKEYPVNLSRSFCNARRNAAVAAMECEQQPLFGSQIGGTRSTECENVPHARCTSFGGARGEGKGGGGVSVPS